MPRRNPQLIVECYQLFQHDADHCASGDVWRTVNLEEERRGSPVIQEEARAGVWRAAKDHRSVQEAQSCRGAVRAVDPDWSRAPSSVGSAGRSPSALGQAIRTRSRCSADDRHDRRSSLYGLAPVIAAQSAALGGSFARVRAELIPRKSGSVTGGVAYLVKLYCHPGAAIAAAFHPWALLARSHCQLSDARPQRVVRLK